jgi:hypothetical protein
MIDHTHDRLATSWVTAQPIEHEPDFVLGREMATGLAPDVLHHPLSRGLRLPKNGRAQRMRCPRPSFVRLRA